MEETPTISSMCVEVGRRLEVLLVKVASRRMPREELEVAVEEEGAEGDEEDEGEALEMAAELLETRL